MEILFLCHVSLLQALQARQNSILITVFCLQAGLVDHRPICKYFRSQIYIACLYALPLECFAGSRDTDKAVLILDCTM